MPYRPPPLHWLLLAVERGLPLDEIHALTKIDPWFLRQIDQIISLKKRVAAVTVETVSADLLREAKRNGISDEELSQIWKTTTAAIRNQRAKLRVA